jgi:hypothetical protein
MASIYADNDVAVQLAPLLRARGHSVTTALAFGRATALDDEQLLIAAEHGWTLVTHNRKDFELLHDAWRRWSGAWRVAATHAGILVVPQRPQWTIGQMVQELDAFFAAGYVLTNELYRWQQAFSGWVRRP